MRGIVHLPGKRGGKTACTITTILAHSDAVVVVPSEQRRDELVAAAVPARQIIVVPPIRGNVEMGGAYCRLKWPG